MRIALFSEVYWPMVSGVGVTLRNLTHALEARGHQVRVYTATYESPDGSAIPPEVHQSPSVPLFLYPDVQWAFPRAREVARDLAAFSPDVVHVATEFAMGLAGLKAARSLGVPVVASAHTDYARYVSRYGVEWAWGMGWSYLKWFYGKTGRVLCPSKVYEQHLRSRGIRNTGLWTRGIDCETFNARHRSAGYRELFGLGPDDLLVTYVGRLAAEKDLTNLLGAWDALGARRGNSQLVLVGQGPMAKEIVARKLPGVHLTGLLTGTDLSEAYASADIFAFPSTTETFGNVVLEGMASGLASVVAGAGGMLDFCEDGRNALLVRPGDTAHLTEQLARLIGDAGLRRQLAAGGLETAHGRRWDAIWDGVTRVYEDAAVGAGRSLIQAA
jgi:glycosyltransferase involved in cell wall biosynthesis